MHAEQLGIELSDEDEDGESKRGSPSVRLWPCLSRMHSVHRLLKDPLCTALCSARSVFAVPVKSTLLTLPLAAEEDAAGRRQGKKAKREAGGKRGPEDAGGAA